MPAHNKIENFTQCSCTWYPLNQLLEETILTMFSAGSIRTHQYASENMRRTMVLSVECVMLLLNTHADGTKIWLLRIWEEISEVNESYSQLCLIEQLMRVTFLLKETNSLKESSWLALYLKQFYCIWSIFAEKKSAQEQRRNFLILHRNCYFCFCQTLELFCG